LKKTHEIYLEPLCPNLLHFSLWLLPIRVNFIILFQSIFHKSKFKRRKIPLLQAF
jgi:hypothetical protein